MVARKVPLIKQNQQLHWKETLKRVFINKDIDGKVFDQAEMDII